MWPYTLAVWAISFPLPPAPWRRVASCAFIAWHYFLHTVWLSPNRGWGGCWSGLCPASLWWDWGCESCFWDRDHLCQDPLTSTYLAFWGPVVTGHLSRLSVAKGGRRMEAGRDQARSWNLGSSACGGQDCKHCRRIFVPLVYYRQENEHCQR